MTALTEALTRRGYKHYTQVNSLCNHTEANALYQKAFLDENGNKLFYLNAHWYEPMRIRGDRLLPESVVWDVQLHLDKYNFVDVHFSTLDINKAEAFFERMFYKMECKAYCELND